MMSTDMNLPNETPQIIHQGRNVRRFREMLGLKQEGLAYELGDDWNQKKISVLEQKETIDDNLLKQIADALKVPVEAIKNFDEEAAIIYFNTFNDNSFNQGAFNANNCTFNPIDKIVALYDDKIALYERMLKEKEDMIGEFKKLLHK